MKVARCINNRTSMRHPVTGRYEAYPLGHELPLDDPYVTRYPHEFEIIEVSDPPAAEVIETTRRNPGESRTTRRPNR